MLSMSSCPKNFILHNHAISLCMLSLGKVMCVFHSHGNSPMVVWLSLLFLGIFCQRLHFKSSWRWGEDSTVERADAWAGRMAGAIILSTLACVTEQPPTGMCMSSRTPVAVSWHLKIQRANFASFLPLGGKNKLNTSSPMSNTACGLFEHPSLWHTADLLLICPSKSHAQISSEHLKVRNKSVNGWARYISATEECQWVELALQQGRVLQIKSRGCVLWTN